MTDACLKEATHRSFESPAEIMRQGAESNGMFLILSGHVDISVIDESGHQSNLVRAGQGDIIGELEALTGRPCLASCRTEKNCTLLQWAPGKLAIFLSNPEISRNIIGLSYDRLMIINQVRSLEHSAPVDRRIADCLLRMSVHDPLITQSQSYIAEAVGCSRQTVNRVLGKLRDAGLISLRKAKIEIHDRDSLARFFDPSS